MFWVEGLGSGFSFWAVVFCVWTLFFRFRWIFQRGLKLSRLGALGSGMTCSCKTGNAGSEDFPIQNPRP